MKLQLKIAFFCIILIKQFELNAQCTFTSSIVSNGPTTICGTGSVSLAVNPAAWTQKSSFMGIARSSAAGFSIGSKGYIGTGNANGVFKDDFWEYDATTDVWTQKANYGGTVTWGAVGFVIGGKGYMGMGTGNSGSNSDDELWEYNPLSNTWTQKASLTMLGRIGAVGFSIGSKGYVGIGYHHAYGLRKDFWEYDPVSDTWTPKADFGGGARDGAVGFAIGGKGYVGTGMNSLYQNSNDFWEYDPVNDIWNQKNNFAGVPTKGASSFLIGNKGYVCSGTDNNGFTNNVWEYNSISDTWTQKSNFAGNMRHSSIGFALNGKGYMGTGYANTGSYTNDFWEFDPSYSYLWSNSATTSSIAATTSGVYSVVVTNAAGCTSSTSISVNINPLPTITVANGTICSGSSFTIVPNGANNYTISGGSNVVSPLSNDIYLVEGSDSNGCIGNTLCSVIVDMSVPSLTVTGTNTVCLGSTEGLLVSGAYTYTWNMGTITPTVTGNVIYTVTSSNSCGVDTKTVSVTVDNTCANVWPGDANSDGVANNLDILELGLHYIQTGAPRTSPSDIWQPYFANNWTGTISNGKNLNHSDCNGDGIIDGNDTLAIYYNYGLTHTFKPVQTATVNPQLSIVPDQSMVVKGMWGTASVYLGDAGNTINNINGVAFTIDFDNSLIEQDSIYLIYQNSFIDAGQNLQFRKTDFLNNKLYTATTHTINNNMSGFGKIATLHFQIKSNLTTDEIFNIGISQANQSDASGTVASLTSGTGTLMAVGASVGVNESILNGNILISPNPTNGVLNISFNAIPQNTKIELYNSIGALVLSESMSNKTHRINTSGLSSGIYFVKVMEGDRLIAVKKVVRE